MPEQDADDFVAFEHVRVVRTTSPALYCAFGHKRVWLPREHIRGRLWSRGDCGTLLVRRWVARDRQLIVARRLAVVPPVAARSPQGQLFVLGRDGEVPFGR
jgi:hypothetical protein